MMRQQLEKTIRWPYSKTEYFKRFLWIILKVTIWKILWHKIVYLRSTLLKLFGSNIYWQTMVFGSTDIWRPWDIKLGKYVVLGPRVHIYNLAKIEIGDFTVISQDVYICGGTHDYTNATLPLQRKDIKIGDNVWIGAGAFIAPGITIGEGAVVGARAAVFKDVEPWTVVGGNPAKFIKKRIIKDSSVD